ncbi:MAG: hypothetical protein K1X83_06595 [Oligoflexia bacterium]|nr:hypothetical protein [Oligoflexia bacterium]
MKCEVSPIERLKQLSNQYISIGAMLSSLVLPGCSKPQVAHDSGAETAVTQTYTPEDSFSFRHVRQQQAAGNWTLVSAASAPSTYNPNAIWYERQAYLEALCAKDLPVSDALRQELTRIETNDPDWRIRELASAMVSSVEAQGNFRKTEPYQRRCDEDRRLTMHLNPANPYNPEAIWYTRLDQLKDLARTYSDEARPAWVVSDLRTIAEHESDWRIAALAQRLSAAAERQDSFAKVEL